MLSLSRRRVKSITFTDCNFCESSKEDKIAIYELLQNVLAIEPPIGELKFDDCYLTDDTFIPIVGLLQFVKWVDFSNENNITCKSLYQIIKVG